MDSILVPCGFILPLHPAVEQDADDAGEQRAAGRGKTHRHEGLGEEPAGQPCARHTHQQDGEGVVQKRQPRPAPGAEIAAEAELDAREQAVEDVAADVGRTGQNHRLVGGEGPHHTGGDELHQKGHHRTEAHADGDGVPEDVVRPVVLARADVLGAQRRHGGEHGAGDEEEEADDLFHDAHRRRVGKAALVRHDGDEHEGHLNKAVLRRHRQADGKDVFHRGLPGAKVAFRQSDALVLQNDAEGQQNAHGLRERRAKCCACRAETERPHEEEVQPDVHHAGCGDEVHGASGVAHPPENRRQHVIGCDAGDADEADGEVGRRTGHGLLRGRDEPDDRVHEAHQRRRQHYRAHHKEGDGVADDLRGLLFVACAHGPADADGGTHRHAHQYHSDHMHHLTADGDSGGACHPLEPADDEEVCHAVEGLQKVREQIGQRESEDVFQHAAAGEVFFHVFRSACPLPSPHTRICAGTAGRLPFHAL